MTSPARTPKLAEITSEEQALNWLAETIQQKATKENAGFVQIEVVKRSSANPPHLLVSTPAGRKITLSTSFERVK